MRIDEAIRLLLEIQRQSGSLMRVVCQEPVRDEFGDLTSHFKYSDVDFTDGEIVGVGTGVRERVVKIAKVIA